MPYREPIEAKFKQIVALPYGDGDSSRCELLGLLEDGTLVHLEQVDYGKSISVRVADLVKG